jgi:hypothetical protein
LVEGASRRVAALRAAAGGLGLAAGTAAQQQQQQQQLEVEDPLVDESWGAAGTVILVQDAAADLGCYWAAVVAAGADLPVEVAEGGKWPVQQPFPDTLEVG